MKVTFSILPKDKEISLYNGILTWRSFAGQFREDLQHGQGFLRRANGDVLEGSWNEGVHVGFGVLQRADGGIYKGYWKDGLFDQRGLLTLPDGSKYEGGDEDLSLL